ncbi:tail terminator [Mycobacterium phage Pixie]|uniref:Minor capsid protein n=2 Tax=Keshuvirus pixie TaxID=1034114 RepID=G1D525_9CAUD|nr:tail terminator [Mycobacterium phage Pixie]AEK09828.1 minor capsid protein [Mycobacterium phage Pixie]AOT23756.1 minor capsid protein [Mycobacterium phage TBond007]
MTILLPPVGPISAARTYLLDELAARNNPLPVGVEPPEGEPQPYALLSRPGTNSDVFLGHFLLRLRVFDTDVVRLERNADLLHRLMLHATHKRIVVPPTEGGDPGGAVWITAAAHEFGPADLDDPDVPMFGLHSAVFWTIGLKPS